MAEAAAATPSGPLGWVRAVLGIVAGVFKCGDLPRSSASPLLGAASRRGGGWRGEAGRMTAFAGEAAIFQRQQLSLPLLPPARKQQQLGSLRFQPLTLAAALTTVRRCAAAVSSGAGGRGGVPRLVVGAASAALGCTRRAAGCGGGGFFPNHCRVV